MNKSDADFIATICHRLKVLRIDSKVKQIDLAKKLHTQASYMSALENGTRRPSLSLLSRWSRQLGTDLRTVVTV